MSLHNKWSYAIILFFSLILLTGCGENNSQKSSVTSAAGGGSITSKTVAALSVANGNSLSVDATSGQITIYIRALNAANVQNTEGNITAQYQNTNIPSGTMSPGVAKLEQGIATFTYTPPANLETLIQNGVTGTQFRFFSENGIETLLNISYVKVADNQGTGGGGDADSISKIVLSESAFSVTQAKASKEITVYAFNTSGVGVDTGTVEIKYPLSAITSGIDAGSVPSKVMINGGIGTFTFTAPSDLSKASQLSPARFTVQDTANSAVSQTFEVSYSSSGGTQTNPVIRVEGAPSVITEAGQKIAVTLLVVDENNMPLSDGTIAVQYPSASNLGLFVESEVSIKNGQAVFQYTAPDPLIAGTTAEFTFRYKENPASNPTVWSVQFSPGTPQATDSNINALRYFGGTVIISENSKSVPIDIFGFDVNNAPVDTGIIRVSYPVENSGVVDIGRINPSIEAAIENGKATFTYVGPADLNRTVHNLGKSWVVYRFCDKATDSLAECADVNVSFALDTTTPQPDLQEYVIDFGVGADNTLNLDALTPFTLSLKTQEGSVVEADRISDVVITSKRPQLAVMADASGNESTSLSLGGGKNPVNAYIKTGTVSGLVDFEVQVTFKDTQGLTKVETEIKSIVIFSGPPTTLSITKNGSSKDVAQGAFKDELVVHVADQYGNPVNTEPTFTVSAIIGPADDPNHLSTERDGGGLGDFGYLYDLNGAGTISSVGGVTYFDTVGNHDFSAIDINNDKLITFTPTDNAYKYPALGSWTILEIVSSTRLRLKEEYVEDPSIPANNLRYVVGHNFRDSSCNSTIGHYNVRVVPNGDSFQLDKNGTSIVNLFYDYPLVGADVFVAANILGYSNSINKVVRIGNAYKRFLTGVGIKEARQVSYTGVGTVYWGRGASTVDIIDTGYTMQYGYAHPLALVGSKGFISTANVTFIDGNTSNLSANNLVFDSGTVLDNTFTGCDRSVEYEVFINAKPGEEGTVTVEVPSRFGAELN